MRKPSPSSAPLSELTAIIKTFERPQCVAKLVRSIRRFYPELKIIVGDDSLEATPIADAEYLRLPNDCGISAGRNALLAQVRTPYFLLLDDDTEFTAATRIERLLELVASGKVDLAAGTFIRCKRKLFFTKRRQQPYHGTMEIERGALTLRPGGRPMPCGYQVCDIVHNFFVARTAQILKLGGWCEALKVHEHEEFFLRFGRKGLVAACCPEVTTLHWQVRPARYSAFRDRDFWPQAAREMGVTRINYIDGSTREFPAIARAA